MEEDGIEVVGIKDDLNEYNDEMIKDDKTQILPSVTGTAPEVGSLVVKQVRICEKWPINPNNQHLKYFRCLHVVKEVESTEEEGDVKHYNIKLFGRKASMFN